MKKYQFKFFVVLILLTFFINNTEATPSDLIRIAFGSCNRSEIKNDLWKKIAAEKPDLWVWLGDVVYGDSDNPKALKVAYNSQKAVPEYYEFEREVPITGVWDDHDYGKNDGGKEFPIKKESQKLFLDFINVSGDSIRRKRPGIYTYHKLVKGKTAVDLVLLDTRYFRDSPEEKNGTILGTAQWKWLNSVITQNNSHTLVLVSSIQVIPRDHRFESWFKFPNERKRLLNLLANSKYENIVILSGDRHFGEQSALEVKNKNSKWRYIREITSSGMTHWFKPVRRSIEKNRYRVGKPFLGKNYGILEILSDSIEFRFED